MGDFRATQGLRRCASTVPPNAGYADDGYTRGNPGLWPERNRSIDLGVEFTSADSRAQVDVTVFHEVLHDEIPYRYGAAPDGSGRASYVQPGRKEPSEGRRGQRPDEFQCKLHLAARHEPR